MAKILYMSSYRRNVQEDSNNAEFWKEQELYNQFFEYEGQMNYDDIVSGRGVEQEILHRLGCVDEKEFIATWRGNSDKAYKKWLKDNGT
jgi:hypothetical protein